MFYKKRTFPEEGDIVICTVKKILPHSVFVDLDEYENLEGMIHISEISPGRIRNLRDYVVEGKKLVCKVLRSNKDNKQIDLSYRRVPLTLQKKKNVEYKQEQRSEKILEVVASQAKVDIKKLYDDLGNKAVDEYGSLYDFLIAILNDEVEKDFIPEKYKDILIKIVNENVRLPVVKIECTLHLESFDGDGIGVIKESLKKIEDLAKSKKYDVELNYISAPNYRLVVTAPNYKDAEKIVKEASDIAIKFVISKKGKGELIR